jgi:hypothetical protein
MHEAVTVREERASTLAHLKPERRDASIGRVALRPRDIQFFSKECSSWQE